MTCMTKVQKMNEMCQEDCSGFGIWYYNWQMTRFTVEDCRREKLMEGVVGVVSGWKQLFDDYQIGPFELGFWWCETSWKL